MIIDNTYETTWKQQVFVGDIEFNKSAASGAPITVK
jgi:hypothetical protein